MAALLLALLAPAPLAAQEAGRDRYLVTPAWLAPRLADPGVAIVHAVSREGEYERGHLPGARPLPVDEITDDVDGVPFERAPLERMRAAFEAAGVTDASLVVVYGEPLAAARAWASLDYLGHGEHAVMLDGGLAAWSAAGHALSRERPGPSRGRLTVRPRPERFVDADWVLARLEKPGIALVDARPENEYSSAAGAHGGMHAGGHIPGAGSLYWQRMMVSREDLRLRPREELLRLFTGAGVAPGDTVVAYCLIGMRASMTYFAARQLGFETRLYDGSWADWSRRGLPTTSDPSPRERAR